ncbi:MAG: HAD hydrolase family protein [Defluviicoccus sp.]
MDVLAVIPVLDQAVLRPLGGRPLLQQAIEQARSARSIDRIAVVSASSDVLGLAADANVDAVGLPVESALTDAGKVLALAADQLAVRDGFAPQVALVLDPSFPLRTAASLDQAIEHLFRCGADSLVSVHPLTEALWVQDEGGLAQPCDGAPNQVRFVDNGAIVAIRMSVFEADARLPAGRIVLYAMPALQGLRLRTEDDWQAAEALMRRFAGVRAADLLRPIKLLVLDFDGVMTDNRVLVMEDGREGVLCSRGDGFGFDLLRAINFPALVISKEGNPVVGARCRKLKIPCEQGIGDKLPVLERLVRERGLTLAQVAYMGNDLNDLDCMRACGVAIAPSDAHPAVLAIASVITNAQGGFGAVREICDLIVGQGPASAQATAAQ